MSDAPRRSDFAFLRGLARDAAICGVIAAGVARYLPGLDAVGVVVTLGVCIANWMLLAVAMRNVLDVRAGRALPGLGTVLAMAFVFAKPFAILFVFYLLIHRFDAGSVATGLVLSVGLCCIRALLHSTAGVQTEYRAPPIEAPSASVEP